MTDWTIVLYGLLVIGFVMLVLMSLRVPVRQRARAERLRENREAIEKAKREWRKRDRAVEDEE